MPVIRGSPGGASVQSLAANARDIRDEGKRHEFDPWGGEDPLKGMATHSSILAWKSSWTEDPVGLLSIEWHRIKHD